MGPHHLVATGGQPPGQVADHGGLADALLPDEGRRPQAALGQGLLEPDDQLEWTLEGSRCAADSVEVTRLDRLRRFEGGAVQELTTVSDGNGRA